MDHSVRTRGAPSPQAPPHPEGGCSRGRSITARLIPQRRTRHELHTKLHVYGELRLNLLLLFCGCSSGLGRKGLSRQPCRAASCPTPASAPATLATQTPHVTAAARDGGRRYPLHLVRPSPRTSLGAAALAGRGKICQQQFPSALNEIPGTDFLLKFYGSCCFRAAGAQVLLITPPINKSKRCLTCCSSLARSPNIRHLPPA